MMGWPKEELRKIASADDFHISPFHEDGVPYSTPIWTLSVAVDEALYARAFNGARSNWYHDAVRQRAGRITAPGRLKEVTFEAVDGPNSEAINDLIDNAFRAKYRGSPYLNTMIGKRARAATVRIMPR